MDKIKELIKQYDDIKKSIVDAIKEFVENKGGKITIETDFYINEDDVEIELQSLYIENDILYYNFCYYDDLEEDNAPISTDSFTGDTFRELLKYLDNNF